MPHLAKIEVASGIHWVEAPGAGLYVLCGAPADSVKHLMKRGLIAPRETGGTRFETGPNAILLSDVLVQNGSFANLAEFPVLHMLYRQGMILPGHPNNTGARPLLIGSREQVRAQMEYIYRGNYGLVSEEELLAAGVAPSVARRMMQVKLAFAFGRIRPTDELIDSIILGGDPVEVKNGVYVRRRELNVFEFTCHGDSVTVDLNLQPFQQYEAPYPLAYHDIQRGYFSVVHSGEGDGWNADRPTMASVIIFQGKPYILDAGPNILYTLKGLGIGITEIEGIFQTHAHDDHFCGLPTLMRSDRRIRYFATPFVRASVEKKLAALLGMDESHFENFFEPHDLNPDVWNEVDGLEVKPVFSPHPVETTVMFFRVRGAGGYCSYAHLADIVDLDVLDRLLKRAEVPEGAAILEQARRTYGTKVDLKKADVGGGLIHGNARDFRGDPSGKLVLSHTSQELTREQREIGSGATFGAVDVLIPAYQDYVRECARRYLTGYHPGVPVHEIETLLNSPIVEMNAESILIRAGERCPSVYLVLTGEVDAIRPGDPARRALSAGAIVGEGAAITRTVSARTYRATGFVQALAIPAGVYLTFVRRNGLLDRVLDVRERRDFLDRTWLFGGKLAYPTQVQIAQEMVPGHLEPGAVATIPEPAVVLIRRGQVQLSLGESQLETLGPTDFFGESGILHGTSGVFQVQAAEPTDIYRIPGDAIRNNPAVRWKLLEVYERRMRLILNPDLIDGPAFRWRPEYCTNVREMDEQHRRLFETMGAFRQALHSGDGRGIVERTLAFLDEYTRTHFVREEELMKQHGFPELAHHRRLHERLTAELGEWERSLKDGETTPQQEFVQFLNRWILEHILTEDRKYGRHLNERGVF